MIHASFRACMMGFGIASCFAASVPMKVLTESGGHLDWHPSSNLIVFDRLEPNGYFRPYLMDSDGGHVRPFPIRIPRFPGKHVGQPAWHPSGKYVVFQVEKDDAPDSIRNQAVPGAGILNDLYLVTSDGTRGWKMYDLSSKLDENAAGILHPHFSPDGERLIWAERVSAGAKPFGAWVIRMGRLCFTPSGEPTLRLSETWNPGGKKSFFETHGFDPTGKRFLFTGQQDVGLEIYSMEVETGEARRLTRVPEAWDEHAHFAPDGSSIAFISSRSLTFTVKPFELQAEVWLMDPDGGNPRRLTYFHDPASSQYLQYDFAVAADLSFSPDGKQVACLVITGRPEGASRGSGVIIRLDVEATERR